MEDPYPVKPFRSPASAKVVVPGSKSMTNRAMILAALADGISRIENCLFSEDTEIMVNALQTLGFAIQTYPKEKRIEVTGKGGTIPNSKARLNVGNSGTSARFLTALCCLGKEGEYELDGVPQMRKRPIDSLANALSKLGADIETANGFFPLKIRPKRLFGGKVTIDATGSSQLVSALLMVAPFCQQTLNIELSDTSIRRGYIEMTCEMMKAFGIPPKNILSSNSGYTIHSSSAYSSQANGYVVEGDASAASYFLALPLAVGGKIEIEGLKKDSLQGDTAFTEKVEKIGASIEWKASSAVCHYDLSRAQPLAFNDNFYQISDTFLTAAAISPLLEGETKIEGIEHTRHQECDRIEAMANGLSRLGQNVRQTQGSLTVEPKALNEATVATYEDHRVAMSFAILGCRDIKGNGEPWLKVEDPLCARKTFPDFFETLEKARRDSEKEATLASK